MNPINAFSSILIGNHEDDNSSDISRIINNLAKTINRFSNNLLLLKLEETNERLIAPFYARTILEASMTMLVLRCDPFRILSIYKVQSSPQYDVTKKSNVSLLWTGDVIATSASKKDIWNPENKTSDLDRALLGKHWGELLWIPSLRELQDSESLINLESQWLDTLTSNHATSYFERIKTDCQKLYSFFSKGIHYEFLIDVDMVYDNITMQNNILLLFQTLSVLGLLSHYNYFMSNRANKTDALTLFSTIERELNEWYTKTNL